MTPPRMWPSVAGTTSAPRNKSVSRLNTLPTRSPVNACRKPLRENRHDSGPTWLAKPSLYETFIRYTLPTYPGASPASLTTLEFSQLLRRLGCTFGGFGRAGTGWGAKWLFFSWAGHTTPLPPMVLIAPARFAVCVAFARGRWRFVALRFAEGSVGGFSRLGGTRLGRGRRWRSG